jgi:Uncharacterized conserved protein
MKADSILRDLEVDFEKVKQDEPTEGCREAAEQRGIEVRQVVKSLILRADGNTLHVLIPGNRTLSESKLGSEYRMVPPEEAKEITGFEPGTVHPFSTELEHLVDFRVFRNEEVSHTTGDRSEAVLLSDEDFREALEKSDFDVEITDLAVSTERDYSSIQGETGKESAKFVVDNGYTMLYDDLSTDYSSESILTALKAFHRKDTEPYRLGDILESTETETEIQKATEKLIEDGNLPEKESFDLMETVESVLEKNPEAVDDYVSGKDSAMNFLMGKVMQETGGRADAQRTKKIIEKEISGGE